MIMAPLHFDGVMGMVHQMAGWLLWGAIHGRPYRPFDLADPFARHAHGLPAEAREAALRSGGGCARGASFECFFAPLVAASCRCRPLAAGPASAAQEGSFASEMDRQASRLNMGWGRGGEPNEVCYGSERTFRQHGGFWAHAQAVAYVFRPVHATLFARRRAAELGALGWGAEGGDEKAHPVIGMHIRRGDKCERTTRAAQGAHIDGACDPRFRAYKEAAVAMQERYGVRHIFVATDDAGALAACRGWANFTCAAFGHEGRGSNSVRNGEARASSGRVSLEIILDVDTLARCDYFVGSLYYSQVSNIAYELLVARKGAHVPFVNFGHWAWGDIDHGDSASVFGSERVRHAGRRTVGTQLVSACPASAEPPPPPPPWWRFWRAEPPPDCVWGYWSSRCDAAGEATSVRLGVTLLRQCASLAAAEQASAFAFNQRRSTCHTYHPSPSPGGPAAADPATAAPRRCIRPPPAGWAVYARRSVVVESGTGRAGD